VARAERVDERRLVNDATPRGVDEIRPGFMRASVEASSR